MVNEKRLIDANALSEKIGYMKNEITRNRGGYRYCNEDEKNEWDKLDSFDSLVCNFPTVDAVEVVHGRWERVDESLFRCSACSEWQVMQNDWFYFCPNCGAKMDLED